ncbi:MAG: thioredoxin [Chloroflexi bacterium]|nr:MAG: thioredoxin [Chloroflexota bacterium]MBL1195734.1 thioredoxin [Chloroflexota bacterium]NOH13023.1 thioredoxin family protein [Chloroflexota bacterium]
MDSLVLRGSIALGIVFVGLLVYWLLSRCLLARLRGRRLGLEGLKSGVPAILYFTSPTCVPCRTVQRPELALLSSLLGEQYKLIKVDCTERPDLAEYWGILSVPTTFIIDAQGQPRHINHGVTRADTLRQQLEKVEGKELLTLKYKQENEYRRPEFSR